MRELAPSFLGTTLATILASGYVILDGSRYHLWTVPTRWTLMGGAIAVLLTYSLSLYCLENCGTLKTGLSRVKGDYVLRVCAQIFLGFALAAIGINLRYFLGFFLAFVIITFLWSVACYRLTRATFFQDVINLMLCLAYAYIAWNLFSKAAEFEQSYSAFVSDPDSFKIRLEHMRGETINFVVFLGLVMGAAIANLAFFVSRSAWVREALFETPAAAK